MVIIANMKTSTVSLDPCNGVAVAGKPKTINPGISQTELKAILGVSKIYGFSLSLWKFMEIYGSFISFMSRPKNSFHSQIWIYWRF